MNLWILRPREDSGLWEPWYDKAFGFVVRAETEEHARALAAEGAGDEGPDAWMYSKFSTCERLPDGGVAEIVMHDFHAA